MSVSIRLDRLEEAVGWRAALYILAAERYQPLFVQLGVPATACDAPERLMEGARRFWHAYLVLLPVRSAGVEDSRMTLRAMLGDFFTEVSGAYDEDLARSLYAWARRQFVDQDARNQWLLWSQLLRRLAGIAGLGYPLVPLPLSEDHSASLKEMVCRHLSLEAQRQDIQRIDCIKAAPASAFEQHVQAALPDMVEGVLEALPEAITNQRAFQVFAEVSATMDRTARQALLEWGKRQASVMELPAVLVDDPVDDPRLASEPMV